MKFGYVHCLRALVSEKGYTLVETMVANAILLGVLIPAVVFFGKITINQHSQDLIVASNLATQEMEKTIGFQIYENGTHMVKLNNKVWHVEREVSHDMGLLAIRIRVFKQQMPKPLAELRTLRIFQ